MPTAETIAESDALASAYELLESGLLSEAHAALTELAQASGLDAEARGAIEAGLARVCLEQQDLEQALAHATRSCAAGNADGFEAVGEIYRRRGNSQGAAAAFYAAYLRAPFAWTRLAAYCELTNRAYREPTRGGHVPPANPLTRLWLYQEIADQLLGHECGDTFERTAAAARARGIDDVELFQFLNAHNIGCDCGAAMAWERADPAAARLWVAGACDPDAVSALVADGVLRPLGPDEKPDRELAAPIISGDGDGDGDGDGKHDGDHDGIHDGDDDDEPFVPLRVSAPVAAGRLPPQLIAGYGLRRSLARVRARLSPGRRAVLLVGFVDTRDPPVIVAVTSEGVTIEEPRRSSFGASAAAGERLAELTHQLRRYKPPRPEDAWQTPTADDQRWMVEALRELCARQGAVPFLRRPLRPRESLAHWRPTAEGTAALLRHLMQHAGLGDFQVDLVLGCPPDLGRQVTLGWFAGIDGNTARFGCDLRLHHEPVAVLATLAHEVAHAWRCRHGLQHGERQTEELLTDLTAVYLGFGIALTNASERHRSSGELMGAMVIHRWSHERTGYLPPQALSYLLAMQSRCRGERSVARLQLAWHLEANQRSFFRASLRALPADTKALRAELGIERWEDEHACRQVDLASRDGTAAAGAATTAATATTVQWEGSDDEAKDESAGDEPAPVKVNSGRPVFRVPQRRLGGVRLLLILGGLLVVPAVVGSITHDAAWSFTLGIAAALAGFLFGPRVRFDQCSDSECEAVLGAGVTTCPRCGGTISGTIARARDRLDAEEQLAATKRARPQ